MIKKFETYNLFMADCGVSGMTPVGRLSIVCRNTYDDTELGFRLWAETAHPLIQCGWVDWLKSSEASEGQKRGPWPVFDLRVGEGDLAQVDELAGFLVDQHAAHLPLFREGSVRREDDEVQPMRLVASLSGNEGLFVFFQVWLADDQQATVTHVTEPGGRRFPGPTIFTGTLGEALGGHFAFSRQADLVKAICWSRPA